MLGLALVGDRWRETAANGILVLLETRVARRVLYQCRA